MTRYMSTREGTAICERAAALHGLTLDELLSDTRHGKPVTARRDAMAEMRRRGASYLTIGKLMQRHHATVMHALRAIKDIYTEKE